MKLPSLVEIDKIRNRGYRPQVVGCFLNDKKILFLYKEKHNLWQLPQGGIDNRESIEKAVLREMEEELGKTFISQIKIRSVIGEDLIEFPLSTQNSRDLVNDKGEKIYMKGKNYFFVVIESDEAELDINETEFDDSQWLSHKQAIEVAEDIYQRGKRRITIKVLKELKELGLL